MACLTRCVSSWETNRYEDRAFAVFPIHDRIRWSGREETQNPVEQTCAPCRDKNHMSSISARSSSFVLPSLFWRRPRSSSSLPSANVRSSSVSCPYFCLSLPFTSFQLPFNCRFITNKSCLTQCPVLLSCKFCLRFAAELFGLSPTKRPRISSYKSSHLCFQLIDSFASS